MKFNHLSLAVIALLIGGCKDKNNTIHPQYQPIVESVYASATIKAAQQYTLYPGMSGRILNFTATEGDRLLAGQVDESELTDVMEEGMSDVEELSAHPISK